MGEIFVAVVKVAGDSETINRALSMASEVITGKSAPSASVELAALPIAALPAAAPVKKVAGKFYCKQCPESFDSVGKISAHTRMVHPKKSKAPKTDFSQGAEMGGEIFCPQKNCGRSFHKRGWLNIHMEKDHGITL